MSELQLKESAYNSVPKYKARFYINISYKRLLIFGDIVVYDPGAA